MKAYVVWMYFPYGKDFNMSLRELAGENWEGEGSDVFHGKPVRDMSLVFRRKSQVKSFVSKANKLAKHHGIEVATRVTEIQRDW